MVQLLTDICVMTGLSLPMSITNQELQWFCQWDYAGFSQWRYTYMYGHIDTLHPISDALVKCNNSVFSWSNVVRVQLLVYASQAHSMLTNASQFTGWTVWRKNRNITTHFQLMYPPTHSTHIIELLGIQRPINLHSMITSSNGNNFCVTAQRPVTRSFDVFFDLRLNKRLSKQSWSRWF